MPAVADELTSWVSAWSRERDISRFAPTQCFMPTVGDSERTTTFMTGDPLAYPAAIELEAQTATPSASATYLPGYLLVPKYAPVPPIPGRGYVRDPPRAETVPEMRRPLEPLRVAHLSGARHVRHG